MPTRQAACEGCRTSKVSCTHEKPTCARCRDAGWNCIYRDRPFKRRRTGGAIGSSPRAALDASIPIAGGRRSLAPQQTVQTAGPSYPNPGYQGDSSHATIFHHLPVDQENESDPSNIPVTPIPVLAIDNRQVVDGAGLLDQIQALDLPGCKTLLYAWLAEGVNLALAGRFLEPCVDAAAKVLQADVPSGLLLETSRQLFEKSCCPLPTEATTSLQDFLGSFSGDNVRWETLGLFFVGVGRASFQPSPFTQMYPTVEGRLCFQKTVTRIVKQCLELALSLDCLNDLQLLLQYENYILHSYVYGDQSYHDWRELGDAISSLLALGYHEQHGDPARTSEFLIQLRRAAFARIYSADKNASIFLGRPPRLHKDHCRLIWPKYLSEDGQLESDWPPNDVFDYMVDSRWSASCAVLKEQALNLCRENNYVQRKSLAAVLQGQAEYQWQDLPDRFQLKTALKSFRGKPIVRDFAVSARMNYLHVLFLIQLTLERGMGDPGTEIVEISASMLKVAVESVLLKEHLANSGTGLIWRIAYYCLPAAGIICLYLLKTPARQAHGPVSVPKLVQDLSVLVAQIDSGSLVPVEDPNHALLAGAAQTIQSVLIRALSGGLEPVQRINIDEPVKAQDTMNWQPWCDDFGSLEFDPDFWSNLAEHPALLSDIS